MNGNNKRTLSVNNSHSSSKTPYELRTELLRQAYDILNNQYAAEHNHDMLMRSIQGDKIEYHVSHVKAPTTDEVIECASKLNDFISQRTDGGY